MSDINYTSDKQEAVNLMINIQYDQLLDMCKKTKKEIEYLKQSLTDLDPQQQLEIKQTEALIFAIEHEVNTKKKEMNSLTLKNRYDQLMNLYRQTQNEVRLLEASLEAETILPKADTNFADDELPKDLPKEKISTDTSTERAKKAPETTQPKPRNHFSNKENRERLNLNASPKTTMINKNVEENEGLLDKWHKSLAKVAEMENDEDENFEPVAPILIDLPEAPEVNSIISQNQHFEDGLATKAPSESTEILQIDEPEKKSKKQYKGLRIFLNVLFYFTLVTSILLASILSIYNHNPDDVASRGPFGYSVMRVATGSMSPKLRVNTVIVTRFVEPSELEINDVVTFLTVDGRTVTHRIYDIYENYRNHGLYGFRLLGDANNGVVDDEVYREGDFIGRVIFYNHQIGEILAFIHKNFLTIIAIITFSLVVLWTVKTSIKKRK